LAKRARQLHARPLPREGERRTMNANTPVGESSSASSTPPAEEDLHASYERMARRESELMQLLGTKSPDRLLHDVRNLLNELALLKAVAKLD
jgi:hypothetical protein